MFQQSISSNQTRYMHTYIQIHTYIDSEKEKGETQMIEIPHDGVHWKLGLH